MNELVVGAVLLAFGVAVYGYIKAVSTRSVIEKNIRQVRKATRQIEEVRRQVRKDNARLRDALRDLGVEPEEKT